MAADPVKQHKIILDESEMPTRWYNLIPDLPEPPPPPLHPGTHEPVGPEALMPLFPMDLILQEVSQDSYIDIPGEVLDVYRLWRPSPLYRAHRLEAALGTPARIYYKYEGVSPAGSHKPNTAVPQAFYNARAGARKLTTETGAGQWGTALAFACALFGLECEVWQVGASYDQKPYRRLMIETFGGTVHRSPSPLTASGRAQLQIDPDHPGSLGIAISEAVEVAAQADDVKYALGSVLNHVLLHQTIIGEEALLQMAKVGETPDLLVGCTGGGSNFAGLSFPFLREKLAGRMSPTIRAVEPASCPSLTRGVYAYDFGDTAGMTPLLKMHTLGHEFVPDPIHAGGLRYHGMAPLLSHVYEHGLMEAVAIPQRECFAAALQFARTEGIVPAPEPTHALAAAIREALACKESGEEKVILTALCGHGHFDLAAYEAYLDGRMVDEEVSDERFAAALATVPQL
jgi:tryptophan synthase beta chain